MIETKGGKVYTGMIVYEAVDGIILRNATTAGVPWASITSG